MQRRSNPSRASTAALAVAASLVASILAVVGPTLTSDDSVRAADDTNSYVPLTPCRLSDQREGLNLRELGGNVARIETNRCDIPAGARAIVAYLTIGGPNQNGWLVGYPAGASRPESAQLNWNAGVVRGNAATITLGAGGAIDVYKSDGFGTGAVVVDVVGAFVPAETATAGRLVGMSPGVRLFDSREVGGPIGPDETIRLALPSGVPADATALAITVTAVRVRDRGFFTAFAAGGDRPFTSILNTDREGQFRSASTIVPVTAEGFDLYMSGQADVVVDASGWFTGPSAPDVDEGLFVAMQPTRLRDTRPEQRPIWGGGAIEVALGSAGITGAAAVATSTTMVGVDARGYTTSYAARTDRGPISTGYGEAAEITAQFGIVPVSPHGFEVFSDTSTDMTVDVFGWFTGQPVAATRSSPSPNPVPRQRVIVLGDSILAGVQRTDSFASVQGASFEVRPESCRRIGVRPSCGGVLNRFPPTAEQTLSTTPYGAFDVLVMLTGYNDNASTMNANISLIVNAAQRIGIRRVVWLSYAREFRSDRGGASASQVYASHNQVLRARAAADPRLEVIEWAAIGRQRPGWTYSDGIHLAPPGGAAMGDFISRSVAHVVGRSCPMPYTPGGSTSGTCADPGTQAPIDPGALYPVSIPNPCVDIGPVPETVCRLDS